MISEYWREVLSEVVHQYDCTRDVEREMLLSAWVCTVALFCSSSSSSPFAELFGEPRTSSFLLGMLSWELPHVVLHPAEQDELGKEGGMLDRASLASSPWRLTKVARRRAEILAAQSRLNAQRQHHPQDMFGDSTGSAREVLFEMQGEAGSHDKALHDSSRWLRTAWKEWNSVSSARDVKHAVFSCGLLLSASTNPIAVRTARHVMSRYVAVLGVDGPMSK